MTATPRPAWFDARLMDYMPLVKKVATACGRTTAEREDLVSETVVYALEHWAKFRQDGSFSAWITLVVRSIASNGAKTRACHHRLMPLTSNDNAMVAVTAPASQIDYVELSQTLDGMQSRAGAALLKRAMGYTLDEIGAGIGTQRERARQITENERKRLRAAA